MLFDHRFPHAIHVRLHLRQRKPRLHAPQHLQSMAPAAVFAQIVGLKRRAVPISPSHRDMRILPASLPPPTSARHQCRSCFQSRFDSRQRRAAIARSSAPPRDRVPAALLPAENVRPRSGCAPSIGKRLGVTDAPTTRCGLPLTPRLNEPEPIAARSLKLLFNCWKSRNSGAETQFWSLGSPIPVKRVQTLMRRSGWL